MKGPHGFALWMNVNVNHDVNLTESIFGHVPVYNFDVKRMKLVYKKTKKREKDEKMEKAIYEWDKRC